MKKWFLFSFVMLLSTALIAQAESDFEVIEVYDSDTDDWYNREGRVVIVDNFVRVVFRDGDKIDLELDRKGRKDQTIDGENFTNFPAEVSFQDEDRSHKGDLMLAYDQSDSPYIFGISFYENDFQIIIHVKPV
ncbi:MAG: hypothetical protein ACQER7_07105 [Bacteroidota bacterium]